jgi:excisionase family DNA binding protein
MFTHPESLRFSTNPRDGGVFVFMRNFSKKSNTRFSQLRLHFFHDFSCSYFPKNSMRAKFNPESIDEMSMRARIAELATKLTWLKPCEAACYMNIGESTLWRLVGEGKIPSSKDSGNVRIARKDIDDYWLRRKRGDWQTE